MEKKVSIIVPVYNPGKVLLKCLDSLRSQSWDNLEIILIDDGSERLSADICDQYADMDSRIRVFHQKNQGVSSARNNGLKKAVGDYIVFVDADDYVEKEYIRILAQNCCENVLPICAHWEILMPSKFRKSVEFEGFPDECEIDSQFPDLYARGFLNSLWDKIYYRDVILDHQMAFDVSLALGEDLLFNLEYLKYVDRIRIIKEPLYNYIRYVSGSLRTRLYQNPVKIQNQLYKRVLEFAEMECKLSLPKLYPVYRRCVADIMNGYIEIWEKDHTTKLVIKYHFICREIKENCFLQKVVKKMKKNRCISMIKYQLISNHMFLTFYIVKKIYFLLIKIGKRGEKNDFVE